MIFRPGQVLTEFLPHHFLGSHGSFWPWLYPEPMSGGTVCLVRSSHHSVPCHKLSYNALLPHIRGEVPPPLAPQGSPVSASANRYRHSDAVGLSRLGRQSWVASAWHCWGPCLCMAATLLGGSQCHVERPVWVFQPGADGCHGQPYP